MLELWNASFLHFLQPTTALAFSVVGVEDPESGGIQQGMAINRGDGVVQSENLASLRDWLRD